MTTAILATGAGAQGVPPTVFDRVRAQLHTLEIDIAVSLPTAEKIVEVYVPRICSGRSSGVTNERVAATVEGEPASDMSPDHSAARRAQWSTIAPSSRKPVVGSVQNFLDAGGFADASTLPDFTIAATYCTVYSDGDAPIHG